MGAVLRKEIVGCERQFAMPPLPTDPERAGSRESWSWDLFQRTKLNEIDHPPELDKEQGTEHDEHPKQGE